MANNTYQTYIEETPIDIYRHDFIRRGAMCGALAKRYPGLAAIGAEADAVVGQLDSRLSDLRKAEDEQIRARAIEDAEKLDVIDVYTELRRTMAVKNPKEVLTLLPEAPSVLRRATAATFAERAGAALSNLKALPEADPLRLAFVGKLEMELAEFNDADKKEDATRLALQSGKVALTLYKSELSQTREAELGAIQNILKDREKTVLFTIPWRKTRKSEAATETTEADATP
ncbi:hypothetical protein [Polyangium jinanense]|uniref:Uncharacterized protein n=1 Tax=Polyangium jinanense TaxID=2829994 RepID=A0A9X3X5I0_9BACT|nr:hypothetical protein [Polyangium jinanense]MDC3957291.1 hypothetical protein [Polyangium jinanense]MDC3982693.1 hypothetical protein [Polyangium jinanense]